MDKPEKLKSTVRAAVTKLITKCDTLLSDDIDMTDCDSLMESLELINEKEALLKELYSQIDELILEKTEYEKELKSVEEYSEKISSLKFEIKMRLKKCKIETEPKVLLETSNGSKIGSEPVKLPKLNIEKFSGDAS